MRSIHNIIQIVQPCPNNIIPNELVIRFSPNISMSDAIQSCNGLPEPLLKHLGEEMKEKGRDHNKLLGYVKPFLYS